MNARRSTFLVILTLALGSAVSVHGAPAKRPPPESDLAPIDVRKKSVDLAQKLAKVETPESLADAGLPHPFNPPGFGVESRPVVDAAPGVPAKAFGDRELLAALVQKIQPKGTLSLGSNQLLIFGKRNLRAGDRITVSFEGQDYNLELVSFDRTNFTLRLNHEEITRPIKPGKNP
jgi:hypothetical protein